ncbi:TonB-dependent receptor [Sphingomonas sp. 2SG]|uniref:TonB-dependent receptor n=1 Tax=Sphingomonas sp. 2SG TaxID=2502201 RepID=UPI0014859201|nr:TonB-dependent receptor [Sphingomonas sp. 2SG]
MKTIALLLAGSSLVMSTSVLAQSTAEQSTAVPTTAVPASDEQSSDIIVTAQRRAERVQDVPIAVAIVSGDQLERQQVSQLSELSRSTASLQINASGGGPGGSSAFIRGIGTAALSRSAESAVGVVVDGVVQGNTNISNLFDISRVEVLRGPQGTLFGQSVSAGVINISTNAPDPRRVSGNFSAQLAGDGFAGSEFGRQVLRGTVNVPVSETSAVRASVYGSRINGITQNTFTGKADELTELGWRARYRGEFDRLTVNIIGDYNYSKGTDGQFFELTNVSGPESALLQNVCGITAKPGNLEHCGSGRDYQLKRVWGVSGQLDYDFGGVTLTSITSRRFQNLYATTDIDRLPRPPATLNVQSGIATDYSQFTQEVRLATSGSGPLQLTLGGFYLNANTFLNSGPQQGGSTFLDFIPGGLVVGVEELARNKTENLSGFGEARYKAGPLTVFAGGRLTHANLSLDGTRRNVLPAPTPLLTANLKYTDDDFSWRAGAQLEPVRNIMVYGTASRGYKNAQLATITVVNDVPVLGTLVRPEKPMAYELGLKTSLFNGRLAVNVDGFYQKVRDFQAQTAYRDPVTQVISPQPINIDRLITKGIEGDIFGRIGRNFTINGSAIYNVAKYPTGFLALDGTSLTGQQIAYAPRFSATLSGEYSRQLSGDLNGFVSLDGQYRSRTRLTNERLDETLTTDRSHVIVGGRIGVRVEDKWSLNAYVSNIGGARIASSIAGLAAQPGTAYAFATAYSPQSVRQVGLQASLDF